MSRRYHYEGAEDLSQSQPLQSREPRSPRKPVASRTSPTRSPRATSYTSESISPLQTDAPTYQRYPPQAYSPPLTPTKRSAPSPNIPHSQPRASRRQSQSTRQSPTRDVPPAVLAHQYSVYSNVTARADNFSDQAAFGIIGVARSVVDQRARESGIEVMRNTSDYDNAEELYMDDYDTQYRNESHFTDHYGRPMQRNDPSQSSLAPLSAAAFPPSMAAPRSPSSVSRTPPQSSRANSEPYVDNPYQQVDRRYSRNLDPTLATDFDPNSIEDDGDDGLEYRNGQMSSMLNLGKQSDRSAPGSAAAGAPSGGVFGALGGLVGNGSKSGTTYDAVNSPSYAAYKGTEAYNLGPEPEKSAWLSKQSTGSKRLRWIVGVLAVIFVIGAVVGGVLGSILTKKSSPSSTTQGLSASTDTAANGDLTKDSAEIVKLLNNKNIHKVFPGIDYTPMYTQYPGCLSYPASQNNVTRDLAVISQMTNVIRLYGTDCNQTELVIHAIDQLGLKDDLKVWMGIWIDTNDTTNSRQIEQAYKIFDSYGADSFIGVIVGNEVLYREDKTEAQMVQYISDVRSNLTSRNIDIKVASSDLGDNWAKVPTFAAEVDIVMSNIHPFFAGVLATDAAAWTYDFWQVNDIPVKTGDSNHIIAETGWPSQGGTDCGAATNCTVGSVAGITEMNSFMDDWVCDALTNNTNYFWFEAFDEPWKISFNEPGKEWEDQWGLFDVNRNLKTGVVIPDCGGKTVTALT
ncbi:glycoside hydrolase superfamily [Calycina marina]|uniref:glucan endo-1,3-beta-D-glucosidase n=1 Tax=Calycina marina TaxID=1763456 RepID=A0A9P7YY55_9HELO|nr:glycoside hydrolase superfamily [Calycina marina]